MLAFHSAIAKPFYIPSESMMPGLLTGDRLVVTKYPYGWSWVSPSFHVLPPLNGRLFGQLPERGDIVIVTPPGTRTDYIKRVIGLPGDTMRMVDGTLIINGQPVKRQAEPPTMIPIDVNSPCGSPTDPALYDFRVRGPDGKMYCRVPIVRETLPNGRSYETVELGRSAKTISVRKQSLRPRLADGRQSRQFAPTAGCRNMQAGWAERCRGRISAAAPSSSHSRSTAPPCGGTR